MKPFSANSILLLSALALAGCAGQEAAPETSQQTAAAPAQPSGDWGLNLTPDPGGKIIVVQMLTDDAGNNRYDPSEFEAHQGDVVRFTLKTGVHNVNFLPDSNAAKSGLPAASALLQLPGQTTDLKITLPEGRYYFHCDPHALLGMKGHVKVEARD